MKKKLNNSTQRRTDAFKLEALEPRLLFSADAVSLLAAAGETSQPFESFSETSTVTVALLDHGNQSVASVESNDNEARESSVELVLIDRSLEGADWIAQQLSAQNKPGQVIHFIEADRDGVDQISNYLSLYDAVSSVQLFSHGSDAELLLGNGTLGMNELMSRADQISVWADTLTSGADLLIYGCDLTASANGQAFATLLGELTRTDIAASADLTGNSALGGNWTLEFQTGHIEADTQLGAALLQDYEGVMTTFTVYNADDAGVGSLRQAILDANAEGGANEIVFSFIGPFKPITELPAFTSQITMSGTLDVNGDIEIVLDGSLMETAGANGLNLNTDSQYSSVSNLQIINFPGDGIALNNTWEVTLTNNLIGTDGTTLTDEFGNGGHGISLYISDKNTIGDGTLDGANVVSGNGLHGISINGFISNQNEINYNFIGTNDDGTAVVGNGGTGIHLEESVGSTKIIANTISGNTIHGVYISGEFAASNVLTSNMIGTTADGLTRLGNGEDGIRLELGAHHNNIGSNTINSANVISGNGNDGIAISGDATSNNLVLGNLIGTNVDGDTAIANGRHGILIYNGAQNNEIGGSLDYESNIISGNTGNGITIDGESGTTTTGNLILGNHIGTDTTATLAIGNLNAGIDIVNGASNNRIGGDRSSAQTNVIVANEYGIKLGSTGTDGNTILGNYIGTNSADSTSLGNTSDGINIWGGASNTVIGGTGNAEGNIISGNGADGVSITDDDSDGTVIKANLIGTNAAGTSALGNGNNGVGFYSGASNSALGGDSSAGEGNLISGNLSNGVELWGVGTEGNRISGNRIGTNLDGSGAVENGSNGVEIADGASNNTIGGNFNDNTGNLISGNANAGIQLSANTSNGNIITGNRIGTNATGDAKLQNTFGIYQSGATDTQIGSSVAGEGNIISGNLLSGIRSFANTSTATIQGNYLGTDALGSLLIGNGAHGINITNSIAGIMIGGENAGEGNIISGNADYGIRLLNATDVDIKGNHIGVDESGFVDIGNSLGGIFLEGSTNNTLIGGSLTGEGNIISGNDGDGIVLGASADNNTITGNTIGLAVNELALLGNAGHGVLVLSSNNRIGSSSTNERNIIAANTGSGIHVDPGATGNALLGNSIWQNGSIGIDLGGDGVTDNDADDVDTGANNLQNFPELTEVTTDESGTLGIEGLLQSSANTTFRIEFFTSTTLDASGHGDARELVGYTTVTTDTSGTTVFQALINATVSGSDYVTATATVDNGSSGFSDTSEYSASVIADSSGSTSNAAPEFSLGSGYHQVDLGAFSSDAVDMATQSDGRYLVLSKANSPASSGKYDFVLTRFNADGSLDSSFGTNGTVISSGMSSNYEFAKALSVQSDGKIIVAGNRDLGGYDEAIMYRYNADGSLDTSFGTAGEANFSIPGTDHTALRDITLMTDGRIVGTGFVTVGGEDSMVIIRTTASGELDTSFNGSGYRIIDTGAGDAVGMAVQIQTDDKIVLVGQRHNGSTYESRIVRLNVDGTLDTTFSGDGHLVLVSSDNLSPTTVAITDDGKIVLGGHSDASGKPSQIVRLLTNGSLDSSFGGSGYVTVNAGDAAETVTRLVIDSDGRLVVVGDVFNGSDNDVSIFRLNTDGSLDTTLGGDGLVRIDLSGSDDIADAVVVDANGNIKIAGEANDQMFIASILENGTLDTRFNVRDSLTGTADYTENTAAIVLDANVAVYDRELTAADNFSGASLTLVRDSAADGDDVFGFVDGNDLSLTGGQIIKNGLAIATFDISSLSGQLSITFTDANGEVPGNADVNYILQQITYLNANDNPPAQVQLNWMVTDGDSGGDLSVIGQTTVSLTASNDAPDITSDGGELEADISIDEGNTEVTVVAASDVDTGAILKYAIFGGADMDSFTIGENSGELSFIAAPDRESQAAYTVVVAVTDDAGASDFQIIDIAITDVNETPTFDTAAILPDAEEDTDYSVTINTSDPDVDDTRTLSATGLPDWLTMQDNNDGTATLIGTPLQGDIGPVSFTLEVEDAAGLKSTRTFSFTVQSVNDATEFTSARTFTVDENTTIAAQITSSDEEGHDPEYAIFGGNDAALFSIDADSGVLTFNSKPDFENPGDTNDDNVYEVAISVTDNGGPPYTLTVDTITITVRDLADEDLSPITDQDTIASDGGIVDENGAIGTMVGITANSVDGDSGQIVSYALSGTDASLFSIDADGIITTAAVLDHETADEHSFTVTATSTDGSTATRSFTVTVTDLADEDLSPITDTDATAGSDGIVDENSAIGSTVGITANTVDGDDGQTVAYALSGTDAALFSIDADGIVTTAAVLDHEAADERSFTVTGTSSDGSTATRDFTVTVTDLADEDLSPITDTDITAGSDGIIDENSAIGSTVGITANSVDGDAGQTVSYALSGTDAALFSIDAGGIVTTAAILDHEAVSQRSFTVTATSSDGSTATRDFTVSVTDLADEDLSPITDTDTTAGSDGIIDENSVIGSTVGIIANSVDGDAGQTVSYELSGTDAALFSIDAGGIVTTAAILDHEAVSQRSFTVTATSSDGSTATRDFTVTVTDLADEDLSPITDTDTTAGSDGIIDENSVIGSTVGIIANSVDGDAGQTVSYELSGTDAALFSIDAGGIVTTAAILDHEAASQRSFTVTATSSDGSTATRDFTVTVTDLADEDLSPITDTDATAGSDGIIDENSAIGSTVGITANTIDGDAGQTVSYALSGTDAALFSIDADGIVTTAAILDHEAASQRSFTVTATSSDGSTATRDFTVSVTDLADEDLSPITDTDATAGNDGIIDENNVIGSTVGITANSVDGDAGQTVSYALSGTDAALFSIDAGGIVTTAAILDHEAASQRSFTVTATSSDGSTATRDFTVTVTDLADEDLSPITDTDATAGSDGIVDENSAIGSTVGITANTVDGDDGQTIAYTLSGTDAALFSIDASGVVTTAAVLDHEAADQRSFTVTATSSDGSTATRDFTVTVTDLADEDLSPITDTDATAGNDGIIDENSAIGSTVGITANTVDGDDGQTVAYALSGTDATLFSVDANGVVTTAAAMDHEVASQRSFTVTATSSDGSTATRDFTVTVTDLPDEDLSPITDTDTTAGSDGIIDENSAIGSTVGITANTIDGDAGQTVSYALNGTDAALFSIDANGVVTTAAVLDHEAASQRNFTVTATSSDGSTATRDFTVTVTDLPDEDLSLITDTDTTAGSDGIIDENSAIGSTVGITANSVDGDAGQTVSYELTGTDAALFDIDANGIVTTAAVLDHEAADQYSFTVTATSTDGSTANHSFTVNVADLNEEPVFTTSATLPDAIEDVLYTTTISTFDADTDDSVTFNNAVIPAWLSLIDNGDGTATFSGTPENIHIGSHEITLEIEDSAGLKSTRTFSLTVGGINDAPVISSGSEFSVAENSSNITTVAASDADEDALSYAIYGGSDAAFFTIDSATGELVFSSTPDFEIPQDANADQVYELIIGVDDGTGSADAVVTQAITITVTDLPDEELSPITDQDVTAGSDGIVNENSVIGSTVGITANTVDGDNGQAITYTLSGADAALFSIDVDGVITTTARLNHETASQHSFTVTATSSDGSATSRSFTVSVNDLNEVPVFVTDPTLSDASEDNLYTVIISISDPDSSDTHTFSSTDLPDWLTMADNTNGTVTLSGTPQQSDISPVDFILAIEDADGLKSTRIFSLMVTSENDAPLITSDSVFTVAENTGNITTVTATDVDGDTLTYAIAGGSDAALFTVDPATGALGFAVVPDYENPQDSNADNVYELLVSADDGTGSLNALTTQSVIVTVTNLSDEDLSPITDLDAIAGSDGTVDENVAIGTRVGITANSVDGDSGQTISYTLSGNDAALFSIDSDGVITTASALDHETARQHSFTVTASSSDGSSMTRDFIVDVTNINEPPVFTSASVFTVPENTRLVTTVTATDVDGDAPTYTIVGGRDSSVFTIDNETGELNFIRNPDFESPIDSNQENQYQVVVAANGSGQLQTTQELLVNVSNVNESPAISTTQIQSTTDHSGNIGTLNISDPDSGDIVELTIVGGVAASSFTYDSATDQLSQVSHLDKGTYTLEVMLIDSNGNSTQATLTITILADPLLQAAQPEITVDTDTLDELETALESKLEQSYIRTSELSELSATHAEVQEQTESLEQSNEVDVEKKADDELDTVDPWNEPMVDELSADALADNGSPSNVSHSVDNEAKGNQTESGEKSRLLALLDGLQSRGLVIAPSILDQFQILPFQLSLAPSMQDGSDKLTQELAETAREQNEQQQLVVAIGTGASVALTAGFVSWLLKAGVLISTAKSSAPLWGAIDPVPVLHRRNLV